MLNKDIKEVLVTEEQPDSYTQLTLPTIFPV